MRSVNTLNQPDTAIGERVALGLLAGVGVAICAMARRDFARAEAMSDEELQFRGYANARAMREDSESMFWMMGVPIAVAGAVGVINPSAIMQQAAEQL